VIRHWILVGREVMEVPLLEWGRWFEETSANDTRRIGSDRIGEVWVSTVFLGLDVGTAWMFNERAPPLLFETMVFTEREGQEYPDSDLIGRWATIDEAEAEHAKVVEVYRAMAEILEQANKHTE
jgi:hypothetical protein